jgi:hypothetical protein
MSLKKSVRSSEGQLDFYSSASSCFKENQSSSTFEPKSKAYVSAMKALQEKIIILESENSDLKDDLSHKQKKLLAQIQDLQMQLEEQKRCSDNTEKNLRLRINELESKEKSLQKNSRKHEELYKFFEVKAKYNEDQIIRIGENSVIDKENFQLEIALLKKTLDKCESKEKEMTKELEQCQRELSFAKDKLKQEKQVKEALNSEVGFLKENNNMQRVQLEENFKCIKSDLIQKNQENLQLIKQLNIQNRGLQRNLTESKKQGDYYKIQYIKLSSKGKEPVDQKKTRSKSKSSMIGSSRNRSSTPVLKSYDCSALNSDSAFNEDFAVNQAIYSTENEIKRLADRYNGIQSVDMHTEEIESYRRNLEDICMNMEKKNKELFELKKKQQESLKLRLR